MNKKKHTYESAQKELQEILAQLQNQQVSVDELSALVKRAAELIGFCKEKLRTVKEETERLFEE